MHLFGRKLFKKQKYLLHVSEFLRQRSSNHLSQHREFRVESKYVVKLQKKNISLLIINFSF